MTPTDIFGNIKLYNADCMEVMKTFKDKQFDLESFKEVKIVDYSIKIKDEVEQ